AGLSPAVPLTIRSLSVFNPTDSSQTLIFIGTGGGKILLFSLNPSDSSVDFLKSSSITNRVIDSILVLDEIGRILVLSDGFLFLIDLFLLQPAKKVGFLKGVTAFSKRIHCSDDVDADSSDLFANDAAVKSPRKSFLKKLANGSGTRVSEAKREEGSSCFVAAAAGKGLVLMKLMSPISEVQSDSEYGGISVVWKEIQGIEGVKTMTWLGDSMIVGTLDGYTLFSIASGKITPIFLLPEASGPPRLKCLHRSKEVLLLVDNVGVVANESGQPVGGSLIFQYIPESIVEMGCYVIVGREGQLDLYSRKSAACMQSLLVAKGSGAPCILASNDRGNGEVVVIATTHMVICYRKVSAEEQIKVLLRKKNFKEAISLVEEVDSEGEISREMLSFVHAQVGFLLLFDLHFEEAVNHFLLSEAMQPSEIFPFIMRDPNRWSYLVPRNRYWGLHPPPVPLEQVVDDGLTAIQREIFLRKAGVDTTTDDNFLLNPPSRAELLQSAIQNMIRYLRTSREKDLTPPVKEGVDTLLMYLYRALNCVEDMEQLASSQNSCVVEELETLLDDSGHLRTLAFLYASKGMVSKALSIWRILARNYSTGLWIEPTSSVEFDSADMSADVISGEKSAAMEASNLLKESSDQDLVLEHLRWIADIDQELAVMVLTSEKRVYQLSPEEVLAAIDPKKAEIQQRYLQWLIQDQDCDDTRFHTIYALSLAKSAIEIVDIECGNDICNGRSFSEMNISDVEAVGTYQYLVRERLQLFLQASDLYDPQEVLHVIEGSELWLEKAILYRKMGQETLVLQILALKLEDSEAAEQYCAEIGRSDAYMQLLDMYLDPQDGKEPMFKAAVRLLHNHGESLDPLQVLEKLSPEMPLQLASDTILRMLRARVHHHRQGQIVHNLSRAIDLDARSARLEERSRHVQINDESTCDSCHARLGTKLFAMYPDDSVVCYKCYRRLGESTSPHGRNFKQKPVFKPGWLVIR
ncbi:vam6/Vps39-like protein, partial [Asparagus officinalis]